MHESGSVGVVKNLKIGSKTPRVDLRAKSVGVAQRIPSGVVTIKIPKDEGVGGGWKRGRSEAPRASLSTRGVDGRDVHVKERELNRAEVNKDTEEVRGRIRRRQLRDRPKRVCKTFANQRHHTAAPRGRAAILSTVTPVALVSRNTKRSGRAELRFLDKNEVKRVFR